MMDEDHWLQLHRGMAYIPDATFCCIGNAIYYNNIDQVLGVPGEGYSVGPQFPTKVDLLDEAYLRLTRVGKTYTAYYSDNGENWIIIGKHDLDLIPKYVGIQTFGAQKYPADADFDYFTLELLP